MIGLAAFGSVLLGPPAIATAQQSRQLSIIRDAETEHTISALATPLLRAGGLSADTVSIRVVVDDRLNAFAAQGQRIFINSGLIMRTDNVDQLVGVIAHEIGHVAGGHLLRLNDQIAQASITALLGALAGVAAGAATGRGDVAGAVVLGSNQAAIRNFLAFSRTQENSADAYALQALDATGRSARGFLEFFEVLGDQELLSTSMQDPYARTHPLSRSRVEAVAAHLARSPLRDAQPSALDVESHGRIRAKLTAFLRPASVALRSFPADDSSIATRYGRAITLYRMGQLPDALTIMDGLIRERPRDPFFHEMRGQMLLDNQRVSEAVPSFRTATNLAPQSALIVLSLAHALIETGDPSLLPEAQQVAARSLELSPNDALGWRLMATAHGRAGDEAMAAYALAEMHLLRRDYRDALGQARKAVQLLPSSSPARLKAQDLILEAERLAEEQKDSRRR